MMNFEKYGDTHWLTWTWAPGWVSTPSYTPSWWGRWRWCFLTCTWWRGSWESASAVPKPHPSISTEQNISSKTWFNSSPVRPGLKEFTYYMKINGLTFSTRLRSASWTLVSGTGLSEYPTGYITSPSLLCLSPRFLLKEKWRTAG